MQGITKDQLCWVVIRCIGILCLVRFVTSVIGFFQITSMFDRNSFPSAEIPSLLGWVIAGSGLSAIYCLAGGATLHRILMNESPVRKVDWIPEDSPPGPQAPMKSVKTTLKPKGEPVDPETQLTETETAQFKTWLTERPDLKTRPQEDQIALFRDAQNRGEI